MLNGRTTTAKVAVLTLLLPYALGGTTPWGGSCSYVETFDPIRPHREKAARKVKNAHHVSRQSDTHLDFNTWNLVTDCDAQTYCADNSTCAYKGCRSDIVSIHRLSRSYSLFSWHRTYIDGISSLMVIME